MTQYQIVQHHRHTAQAVSGKFGVYAGEHSPNSPSQLISAHATEQEAREAMARYEAADKRRASPFDPLLDS